MPNKKFAIDPSGNLIKDDPINKLLQPVKNAKENIMDFVSVPSPTNVPGVSPQEAVSSPSQNAAARPLTAPQIAPAGQQVAGQPMLESQAPGHKFAKADATIWNPNTGEKMPWTIGAPMPGKDWKLWTGGTATGQEAQEAIIAGQTGEEAPPSIDVAGDALTEEPPGEDEEPPTTEDPWEVPEVSEILEDMGIETTTIHDYTQDEQDLLDWQTAELEALELEYERKYEEQNKADKNSLGALQAKLLNAGVSLDGTSFESAIAGEVARAEARIKALEREEALAEARINSSYLKGKMDLGKQERDEVWNAKVFDYNNIFKGKGIQRDMWTMFNERDQFEKQLEQEEEQFLMTFNQEKHKLDQAELDKRLARVFKGLEQGLFDMYNEDTVNMLYGLEQFAKLEVGEMVDMGTGGYWNRMANMTLKSAQTESMLASAEKTRLTTPLTIEKMKMEIAESKTRIAKMQSGASGGSKQEKEFYKDAERWRDKLANLTTPTLWGEAWNWMAKKYDIDPTRDTPEDVEAINMLDEILGYKVWRDMDDLKTKKIQEKLSEEEEDWFKQLSASISTGIQEGE